MSKFSKSSIQNKFFPVHRDPIQESITKIEKKFRTVFLRNMTQILIPKDYMHIHDMCCNICSQQALYTSSKMHMNKGLYFCAFCEKCHFCKIKQSHHNNICYCFREILDKMRFLEESKLEEEYYAELQKQQRKKNVGYDSSDISDYGPSLSRTHSEVRSDDTNDDDISEFDINDPFGMSILQ
jgi:hypothetical protein